MCMQYHTELLIFFFPEPCQAHLNQPNCSVNIIFTLTDFNALLIKTDILLKTTQWNILCDSLY